MQPARPDCYGTVQEWNAFQDFLLGFLLLHHFHSIEAAVRECRLLLCYTEVKNTQEAFCYGIMDQRWSARGSAGHPLVLLVGQSNMAGRGDLTPENTITAPDCFMLRMGRWQEMSEPINVDRAVAEGACPRSGANLAASFAAQLQKRPEQKSV